MLRENQLAAKLGEQPATVVIAEDDWLASLYSDQMTSVADYVRCSAKLQGVVGPHVISLLKAGVSVVLDFPANTAANRKWMHEIIELQVHLTNCIFWMFQSRLAGNDYVSETVVVITLLPQRTSNSR